MGMQVIVDEHEEPGTTIDPLNATSTGDAASLGTCECADPGCACKGRCAKQASEVLFRVDMVDAAGTRFCSDCAEDAIAIGLFSYEEDDYGSN